jgi:two-component system chemotaxis response regulator CheB
MTDSGERTIRVLIVDDSAAFRAALALALDSDEQIEVVGQAGNGTEAIALAEKLRPDVITMDVVMPVCDGLEAAARILAMRPLPIVLLSTLARSDEQRMALNALRLGVVDVTNKPTLAGPGGAAGIAQMIRLVKAAAEVELGARSHPQRQRVLSEPGQRTLEVIAIAASTGGPPTLERILGGLPASTPPVVIAQHLAPSFARGFADWLSGVTGRQVLPVTAAQLMVRGRIYIAGENQHIRVRAGYVEGLSAGADDLAPRGDLLFQSVATALGPNALGLVLTGMGSDGATGLKAMRAAGAWTIAQDHGSSVVYGMPRAAAEAGACCEVLALDEIPPRISGMIHAQRMVTA